MATVARAESPRGAFSEPWGAWTNGADAARVGCCSDCSAALAHDQRYCVECGHRRGPLPAAVVAQIAAGHSPLSASADAGQGSVDPDVRPGAESWRPWRGGLPPLASSAVGIAVMSLLGFGTLIGAIVTPAGGTGASEPVRIALAPPAAPSTPSHTTSAAAPAAGEATSQPAETSAPSAAPSSTPSSSSATPRSSKGGKGTKPSAGNGTPPASAALPPIKHVFVIVLADQGVGTAFSATSPAPYLSKTLTAEGELVRDYYAVSSGELSNMIALVSGQGPTPQTAANCPLFSELTPATAGSDGQVLGTGCVYPKQALTIGDQLTSAGKSWRAYIGGLESAPSGAPTSCRHPALGAPDTEQAPIPGDPYVTWRNPFVYFDSLTSTPSCAQDDVSLQQLKPDLASASKTPAVGFIVPDSCHDASPQPCAPGAPAGLAPAGAFLEKVVPEIELSPAYQEGGLIAITFDRAPQSGPEADPSGCCLTAAYPNLPAGSGTTSTATTTTTTAAATSTPVSSTATSPSATATPAGGGKVGLLLISKYIKPGSTAVGEYNHFALLLSIEKLFELKPLGYAGAPGLLAFDNSVYNAYK